MYGTLAGVAGLTAVSPQTLNQADQTALDALLTSWLQAATATINGFLQRDLETEAASGTTLAQASARGATELQATSVAAIASDDELFIGAGVTREFAYVAGVSDISAVITLDRALRYAHMAGEPVRRAGLAAEVPQAVHNAAERMVANLVALAAQRRTTPIVQTNEFEVQLSSDSVFTQAIQRDIRPWRRRPGFSVIARDPGA